MHMKGYSIQLVKRLFAVLFIVGVISMVLLAIKMALNYYINTRLLPNKKNISVTYCNIYDISKDSNENYTCVETKTIPITPVCVYSNKEDIYISSFIATKGVWEEQIIGEFQAHMRKDPTYGLIDIGANIGFYSLLTAKMGHRM